MEKIKVLKEKHKLGNLEQLSQIARTRIPRMQDNLKNKDQHLSELETKIGELRLEISTLENNLHAEEHTLGMKKEEYIMASATLKELEADRNQVLLDVHQLQSQKNQLKNRKPNTKDEEVLKNGRQKLKLYRQFTGIKWDFGAPKGFVKGYVTNGKDHIHTFNYQTKRYDHSKLENKLWEHIERGTGRFEFIESDCKENNVPN